MESTASTSKKRRFLPQPMEISTRSSRNAKQVENHDDSTASPLSSNVAAPQIDQSNSLHRTSESTTPKGDGKPIRRFNPEPVESSKTTRRPVREEPDNGIATTIRDSASFRSAPSKARPRKFAPQLIETASRSVRSQEVLPRTELNGRGNGFHRPPSAPNESSPRIVSYPGKSADAEYATSRPPESRFSHENLSKREAQRRHSFRIPDLPSIPSNSSENSDVPSLSTSPSISSDDGSKRTKFKNRYRESCDERFSGYLLSLATRSTKKQLQDQALAAFPNEQVYNPVSHFAIDKEDDEFESEEQAIETVPTDFKDDSYTFRRESVADLSYELEQMRRHKENAEDRAREGGSKMQTLRSAQLPGTSQQGIVTADRVPNTKLIGGWQKDVELVPMRHAASPPMLGGDIVFPFSLSPQSTKCETDALSPSSGQPEFAGGKRSPNLWAANPHIEAAGNSGLWMGLCQKADTVEELTPKLRSGIVTPSPDVDGDSYFSLKEPATFHPAHQPLRTPAEDQMCLDQMDSILMIEQVIAKEFHDGFVTQVYNYLSLGYPSLARPYDHELSKISGIPVSDLRSDDLRTDAKGYVGAPEGVGVSQDGVATGQCMRWLALRLYIREWARQQPGMVRTDKSLGAWGVRERRGSWAI